MMDTVVMFKGTSVCYSQNDRRNINCRHPSEIAEKLKAAEKNGLKEVSLLPPLKHIREIANDFANEIIPLCKNNFFYCLKIKPLVMVLHYWAFMLSSILFRFARKPLYRSLETGTETKLCS